MRKCATVNVDMARVALRHGLSHHRTNNASASRKLSRPQRLPTPRGRSENGTLQCKFLRSHIRNMDAHIMLPAVCRQSQYCQFEQHEVEEARPRSQSREDPNQVPSVTLPVLVAVEFGARVVVLMDDLAWCHSPVHYFRNEIAEAKQAKKVCGSSRGQRPPSMLLHD